MAETSSPALLPTRPLLGRKRSHVRFAPDAAARAAMAADLDLIDLPALVLEGEILPEGRHDLRLEARLTARAVQACSVTLAPVPAQIDEQVARRYLADYAAPEADEAEVPEDTDNEALGAHIDLAALAAEALALALPLYPRAPGAELGEAIFSPPGAEPLRDADLKPFAGLAGLAAKLSGGSDEKGG